MSIAKPSFLATILFVLGSPSFAADRPKLITEELYAYRSDAPPNHSSGDIQNFEVFWHKLLLGMRVDQLGPLSDGHSACHYDNALAVLKQIRLELGEANAYQKLWAENQDKVFSACDVRRANSQPPQAIKLLKPLPSRAPSDFLYQSASYHFYKREFDKSLELYQQVENDSKAPLRATAAYMTLRCLAQLKRVEEAYDKADRILADPSFKTVHDIAANYRFILMNPTAWPVKAITAELASKHLAWLVSLIKIAPANAADFNQAYKDYFDALEQLDGYFPLFAPDTLAVDWWITDTAALSPRMQAVKNLAPTHEFVDWMQAQWAYNVFTADWLWALHQKDHAYWAQNQNIVSHAWKRWQQGDGGEWLQIAITRTHPQTPLAGEIIKSATPFLTNSWQGETLEYREWLFDLWENLIRLHLGRGEHAAALDLMKNFASYKTLFDGGLGHRPYTNRSHGKSLKNLLRWLVYAGKTDDARLALQVILQQYPVSFKHWRNLLASEWNEVIASAPKHNLWDYRGDLLLENGEELWQYLINMLPAKKLYQLAEAGNIESSDRGYLARAALTRAFLLNMDDHTINQYSALVAKLNPSIRERVLSAVDNHSKNDYIDLMLRMPRFRPQPFTGIPLVNARENEVEDNFKAIDIFNHKDNNWWCRFDQRKLEDRLFDYAKVTPYGNLLFRGDISAEFAPYIEHQKAAFAKHPYKQLLDKQEIAALEAIPDAPQYLSEAVITRKIKSPASDAVRKQQASNLHHAIRTTRYGCVGHGPSSKQAFLLLQNQYSDTVWATATPYWFDYSKFFGNYSP
ncbi:hypothetical protein [Methylomonas methanica]|uniref:hypothetical protein n=1 Tax=Methylomonas methanica TaxID=421 RepID=UPI000AB54047|nr:hypothetical protein [Methylomonas methanica]